MLDHSLLITIIKLFGSIVVIYKYFQIVFQRSLSLQMPMVMKNDHTWCTNHGNHILHLLGQRAVRRDTQSRVLSDAPPTLRLELLQKPRF